jgi:hypothetical protein
VDEKPASTDAPVTQPRDGWWIRLIRYTKRKMDERTAKRQEETPADKAARVTANATVWISIFTLVSVGVSVGTYLILKGQLNEMHDGGVDTHTLAQQALAQGTLLRQQVVGTFAAAIPKSNPWPDSITDAELLHYQGIGLSFVNIGKVKAVNFIAEATLTRQSLPTYKPLGLPEHKQTSKLQMRPNEQTGPPGTLSDAASIRFDAKALTERDVTSLHELRETIEIDGYFQYGNGFGETIREPFCFLYAVRPQHIFEKSGAATGGGGPGGWYGCEDAKGVISQALKWKQKQ